MKETEGLPIQYHLEIYEGSRISDPSWGLKASAPFPTFSVGDFFNRQTFDRWYEPPAGNERFRVKEIEHILWEIENQFIGHKLILVLETVQVDDA
ncbi:MAG: hypothetical protein RKH07_14905 [Gammaproteobacteria bacterium]